ncbi:MAG: serine hydrolase [Immundisolibacterales bacterium]|nr:serine hydrolase [Immundisolibacterales bacterium]
MKRNELMAGFPPSAAGQVTLANWRRAPFNKWSFTHLRELIPSAGIAADPGAVSQMPVAGVELEGVEFEFDGSRYDLGRFLAETDTDGMLVLRADRIVHEHYGAGMDAATPHFFASVTKSVLGLVAGILAGRGTIDAGAPVTDWIPEVAETAWAGATLRDLLDMRVGIRFDEDYLATSGAIIEYRKAQGWDPLAPGEEPSDLRSFFRTLTARDGPHAGAFHYVSPNTDLLGWVIERAAGRRYVDLVSELLWKPMGAAADAYVTVDRLGAPRAAGGMCATLRDLARIGQLVANRGRRDGKEVVPADWIEDILGAGDPSAWDAGDFAPYFPGLDAHYRSKWYVRRGAAPLAFGVGVYGQNVFADPENGIVIAKFSSQAPPLDERLIALTMRGVESIRHHLAGG